VEPFAKGAAVKEQDGDDPAVKRAKTPQDRAVVKAVREIAERRGASPATVVLAWHKAKDVFPIPGVKTLAQAKEVVEALGLELSEDKVRQIDEVSQPFLERVIWPEVMRAIPGSLSQLLECEFSTRRIHTFKYISN